MKEECCTCVESFSENYCPYSLEMASREELEDEDFLESIKCSCCDYCSMHCMLDI